MFLHTIHHHGRRIHHTLLRRLNLSLAFLVTFFALVVTTLTGLTLASSTANFTIAIVPAPPLSVSMIDSNYAPIEEPEVRFSEVSYSNDCQEMVAILASDDQQVYISNYDSGGGWTVTISAVNPTTTWSSGEYEFDFNDPTGDGCVDGDDPDSLAGSMEIYTTSGALESGSCSQCSADFVNLVPAGVFDEATGINTVALVYATSDVDNRGDWKLFDIIVHQTIPSSQPAVSEYEISLLLTITAN